jgi:hypothetical protein
MEHLWPTIDRLVQWLAEKVFIERLDHVAERSLTP